MKIVSQKLRAAYENSCRGIYSFTVTNAHRHANIICGAFGVVLLSLGLADVALAQVSGSYNDEKILNAASYLLGDMIEGSFGALVMIVAGLVAIIAAAMGAYKAAMSALVVAVGAFILRSMVTLFFDVQIEDAAN